MELLIKFITVTGLGILELWAAIPAGTALKLHPLLIGIASALGAIIGAVIVIFFGDRLCIWLLKKKEEGEKNKGRIYKIWNKYGVIGLGMLSPLITGCTIGGGDRNFIRSITQTTYYLDEYRYSNLDNSTHDN